MHKLTHLLLALVVSLSLGFRCVDLGVFLVDADVDDDGVVGVSDVALVAGCQGVEIPDPIIVVEPLGCPLITGPPATGCEEADLDGSGAVGVSDLGLLMARLGQPVCNGSEALCGRRFDQVAYPTTHNAMGAQFPPYSYSVLFANQCSGVPTQLADGVRALMLDIHWWQAPEDLAPDLYLCHSQCGFGSQRLVDGLIEVREFLDANPAEVLAFIIETNAGSAPLEAAIRDDFAASGLLAYVHTQTPGGPWPTLGTMIGADERLVVLTDDSDNSGCGTVAPCPWYHYLWSQLAFETPFSFGSASDFTCDDLRGSPVNDLFILNHFLTRNAGAVQLAELVNHNGLFGSRGIDCWRHQGRIPNFITVDYYEVGDLFRVTDLLNFTFGATGGSPP